MLSGGLSYDHLLFCVHELKKEVTTILSEYSVLQNKYRLLITNALSNSLRTSFSPRNEIKSSNDKTAQIDDSKHYLSCILNEVEVKQSEQLSRYNELLNRLTLNTSRSSNLNMNSENNMALNNQREMFQALAANVLAKSQISTKEALDLSSREASEKDIINRAVLKRQQEMYEKLAVNVLIQSKLDTSEALLLSSNALKIQADSNSLVIADLKALSSKEESEQVIINNLILKKQQDMYENLAVNVLIQSQLDTSEALLLSSNALKIQADSNSLVLAEVEFKQSEQLSRYNELLNRLSSNTTRSNNLNLNSENNMALNNQREMFQALAANVLAKSQVSTKEALDLSRAVLKRQQEMYEKLAVNALIQSKLDTSEALLLSSNALKIQADSNSSVIADLKALSSKEESEQVIVNNLILKKQQEMYEKLSVDALAESQAAMEAALMLSTKEAADQVIANNFVLKQRHEKYGKLIVAFRSLTSSQSATSEALILSAADLQQQSDINLEQSDIMESMKLAGAEKDIKFNTIQSENNRLQKQIAQNQILRIAETALMETGRVRSLFTNVAHDLKTPLQSVMLAIETFGKGFQRSSEENDILLSLDSACNFMKSIINRAIDSTKVETGVKLVPILTSFDLRKALAAPIEWMKPHLDKSGNKISLTVLIPSDISFIFSDKNWIQENLLCYLSNAVKYSSGSITEVIVSMMEGGSIRISVEDHGIGISATAKEDLFLQCSQVNRVTLDGTGLGLYSLKIRSEAIGGSYGVEDRRDGTQGSVFWFSLPCHPDFTDIDVNSTDRFVTRVPLNENKLTILICDDSPTVCKILKKMILKMGHNAIVTENGLEGFNEMVKSWQSINLVLMDVQMPIMDGIEATRRFRDYEENYTSNGIKELIHLPIICSSANDCQSTTELAISVGVDGFLHKPFKYPQLIDTINTYKKETSWVC